MASAFSTFTGSKALDDEPQDTRDVLPMAAGFEASLALAALLLGWLFGVNPLATLRTNGVAAAYGVLASIPLFVLLALMIRFPYGPLRDLLRVVDQLVGTMFQQAKWYHLGLIALMAGIGEELLFRGFVQSLLAQWTGSPIAALIGAGLLFGLLHSISRTYAAVAAAVGIYLGGIWMLTDNLLTPILTHAVYDFGALWYLQRTGPSRISSVQP